ncbi:MAG: hypothetical protein HZC36_03610 [Armatimonadetes bacterium]|nr:hypothetical protein [Armatimonadota bacterium]
MSKRLMSLALGAAALFALALPFTLVARAQDQGAQAAQGFQGQGQGFPPPGGQGLPPGQGPGAGPGGFQRGQGQFPGMMLGPGGGAAMVEDNNFLYVLAGNRLLKVSKTDLKILNEANLGGGMMPPGGPGGFPAQPGQRGGGNPPPEK